MSGVACNWGPGNPSWARCTCHDGWWGITPPPPCPVHPNGWPTTPPPSIPPNQITFVPTPPPRLSDEDVERIARKVAELLRDG